MTDAKKDHDVERGPAPSVEGYEYDPWNYWQPVRLRGKADSVACSPRRTFGTDGDLPRYLCRSADRIDFLLDALLSSQARIAEVEGELARHKQRINLELDIYKARSEKIVSDLSNWIERDASDHVTISKRDLRHYLVTFGGYPGDEAVNFMDRALSAEALLVRAEEALRPFARIKPSSFCAPDGSENECYAIYRFEGPPKDAEFTGLDLARARQASEALLVIEGRKPQPMPVEDLGHHGPKDRDR